MTKVADAFKMVYWVVGWKTDPMRGTVMAFDEPKSSDPGQDVERALALGCSCVTVDVLEVEVTEEQREASIQLMTNSAMRDSTGRYFDPPLQGGILTYHVVGMVPTGKFHPIEKGKMLHRTAFRVEISDNPRRDVERALRLKCTTVIVGVNYEQSEEEKRGQEEQDRRQRETGEEARRMLGRWRQSRAAPDRTFFMIDSSTMRE